MKYFLASFILFGFISNAYAEDKHTYSEPRPNIEKNGCPKNEQPNEYHQCVKNGEE